MVLARTTLCLVAVAAMAAPGYAEQAAPVHLTRAARSPLTRADTALRKGRLDVALRAFRQELATNPGETRALVGAARVLARSGHAPQARGYFERALVVQPGLRDARLGLAWLDLWTNPTAALREIRALRVDYPADTEVKALERAAGGVLAPRLSLGFGRQSDSDGTSRAGFQLDGSTMLRSGTTLRFLASQAGPRNDRLVDDAGIASLQAGLDVAVGPGRRLDLRLGADRRTTTTGEVDTAPSGQAQLNLGLGQPWRGAVALTRETVSFGPRQIDASIAASRFEGQLYGEVTPSIIFRGRAARWHVGSDDGDVRRDELSASLGHRWQLGRLPLEAGYAVSYMDHDRDVGNGFWSPGNYVRHAGYARANAWLPSGLGFSASFDVGSQSYQPLMSAAAARIEDSVSLRAFGMVSVPLGQTGMRVEVTGQRGEAGLTNAGGYVMNGFGVRLAWKGVKSIE